MKQTAMKSHANIRLLAAQPKAVKANGGWRPPEQFTKRIRLARQEEIVGNKTTQTKALK